MSEKHLTELPWKTLAIKKQVKDGELTKALAAFGKTDAGDRDGQLRSLDKVLTAAGVVKRGYKDDKEVVAYLDEILKEAQKTRAAVNAAAKGGPTPDGKEAPGEAPEDDDDDEDAIDAEAEEYRKDYKSKLTSAMSQVRGRAPQPGETPKAQLRFVAMLGAKGASVLVAANVGGPARKVLKALAGGVGGAFVAGECIFEKNAHTFVVQTVPGGLAGKLAHALKAQTGMGYKVRVRTPNGSVVEDDDTEAGPSPAGNPAASAAPQTAPAAPPPDPASNGSLDELKARLARLSPQLKEAMAAGGEQGIAARAMAAEVAGFAKTGNVADALAAVARLEAALNPVAESDAVAETDPDAAAAADADDAPEDPTREKWLQMYAELIPGYEEAIDREDGSNPAADEIIRKIQTIWEWAENKVEEGAYDKGVAALERLTPLFDSAVAAKANGAGSGESEIVRQRKFLLNRWAQIPGELHAEVAKLTQQIAATMPEEDAAEIGALTNDYIDDFLGGLTDEVNNAINAGDVAGLSALKAKVNGDALFAHMASASLVDGQAYQRIVISVIEELETNLSN